MLASDASDVALSLRAAQAQRHRGGAPTMAVVLAQDIDSLVWRRA